MGEVRCYEVRNRQLAPKGSFAWRGAVLALAPTHSHRFLAVFDHRGMIRITELPSL